VKSTPLLSTCNRFEILANICDSETVLSDVQNPENTPNSDLVLGSALTCTSDMTPKARKPKWERSLPKAYTIASTEGNSNSLKLKVEIETTDTTQKKSLFALVDCGATGEFIDQDYAKSCWLNLVKLTQPIPVYNVDGTPNEAGSITEVVNLILHYKNHSERTTFAVTSLGKQKLLLGHSWLRKHNPEIDWAKGEVKMSRCPPHCCSGCRDELRQERITQKAEARRLDICSVGSLPEIDHDSDPDPILGSEDESPLLEEGDRILATGLLPSMTMDIRASSTISQRLAEAYHVNAEALNPVPDYLKEFTSVFSKTSFDVLPEPKKWDHAIELIPEAKMSGCKVYPLSPSEQKELDAFLKENLETGRI